MRLPNLYVVVLAVLGLGVLASMPFRRQQPKRSVGERSTALAAPQLRVSAVNTLQLSPAPATTGAMDRFSKLETSASAWGEVVPKKSTVIPAQTEVGNELDHADLAPDFTLPSPPSNDAAEASGRSVMGLPGSSSRQVTNVRHMIRDGDTLSSIAAKYYGDAQQATRILEANRDKLAHPELLPLGIEIDVPGAVAEEEP